MRLCESGVQALRVVTAASRRERFTRQLKRKPLARKPGGVDWTARVQWEDTSKRPLSVVVAPADAGFHLQDPNPGPERDLPCLASHCFRVVFRFLLHTKKNLYIMSSFLLLKKQIKDGLKMCIAVCYRGQTIKWCTPTGPRSLVGKS
jgi:hypothetical protein